MKIKIFCPFWLVEPLTFGAFVEKACLHGFDGVEVSLPFDKKEKAEMISIIKSNGLEYIVSHWETLESNFRKHKDIYISHLDKLIETKPLFINSQTGKDYYSFEQNSELIGVAREKAKQSGISILHETHRGKFSFAAHVCRKFIDEIPDLRLTADLSHWCNVAETFLYDQEENVTKAIERVHHVHARVGHTQSAQVPDPRVDLWQEALERHAQWWDKIVELRKNDNWTEFTFTPEFGAPPYMILQPFTNVPITNQWDINTFMKDFLKNRYKIE